MEPRVPPDEARRSLRLTRPGWSWLLTAAVLLALGLAKNINLLTLLGYFLAVVVLLNLVLAGRGLRGLEVSRRHGEPTYADDWCHFEVVVAAGRRECRGVWLLERGARHVLAWRAARLGGRPGQTFHGQAVLPDRGRYARGPLWAVSGYPFGLARRLERLAPPAELLVLPRLGAVRRGALRRRLRGADPVNDRPLRRPPHPAAQGEIHGLRAFRTGDSPRTIHWRTSARRGELMVREFEDLPGDSLLLVLDPTLPPGPEGAGQFEDAVSLAATLAREWCRGGADRIVLALADPAPVLLDGSAGPGLARQALERLAVAAAGADAAGLLARVAALPNPPSTAVVVSAGPGVVAALLRRQLRRAVTAFDVTDPDCRDFYESPRAAGAVSTSERIVPAFQPPGWLTHG